MKQILDKGLVSRIYKKLLQLNKEAQPGIKIAGRNSNHLRYADDTILMAECEE